MQLRPLHIEESPSVELVPAGHFTWEAFVHFSHLGFIGFCVSVALSIAVCQIFIVAVLAYWLLTVYHESSRSGGRLLIVSEDVLDTVETPWLRRIAVPAYTWLTVSGISGLFGISVGRSFVEMLKTSFYLLIPFCVFSSISSLGTSAEARIKRMQTYLIALITGQSIAGIHSIVSAAAGFELPPGIPGPVTESGQLVLILPMLVGLIFVNMKRVRVVRNSRSFSSTRHEVILLTAVTFLSLLLVAWPSLLFAAAGKLSLYVQPAAAVCACIMLLLFFRQGRQIARTEADANGETLPGSAGYLYYTCAASSVLFLTLLINLKRGPWLGVFVELMVLGFFFSRRLIAGTIAASAFFLLTLAPARDRVGSLVDHFMIEGGRMSMWRLGAELVSRYPLGVGLKNASYMRTLDPTLPYLHRHMHNNLLNVAVESGWIGAAAFTWWMIVTIYVGFHFWRNFKSRARILQQARALILCASVAVLGWQVSGLVEYNFGDGEVRLIVFFLTGLILSLSAIIRVEPQSHSNISGGRRHSGQQSLI